MGLKYQKSERLNIYIAFLKKTRHASVCGVCVYAGLTVIAHCKL